MPRTSRVFIAAVLCLLLPAASAPACCDDFWSCAAAVATAGLTCAVEAAIGVVRLVISDLGKARADHEKTFNDSVASIKGAAVDAGRKSRDDARRAATDAQNILAEARRIAGDDLAFLAAKTSVASALSAPTATPTPRPGTSRLGAGVASSVVPTAIPTRTSPISSKLTSAATAEAAEVAQAHDVMKDMGKEIEDLWQCVREQKLIAEREMVAAEAQEAGLERAASKQFKSVFLDKLDKLLGDLQAVVSNPANIVEVAGHAADDLEAVIDGYDKDVPPIVDDADQKMRSASFLVTVPAMRARFCADQAAAILAKMRRAAQIRAALERRNVAADILVLRTPTPPAYSRVRSSTTVAFLAASRTFTGRLEAARLKLRSLPGAPAATEVATFRRRVSTDLDSMFAGKAGAAKTKQRDDLLAEARRRFAGDPKTLQALEKLLLDQARTRGVN